MAVHVCAVDEHRLNEWEEQLKSISTLPLINGASFNTVSMERAKVGVSNS